MTIALFLTEKTSFAVWERGGFLARGVKAYNRLASACGRFYFVSYGDASECAYQPLFVKNCSILYKRYPWMPLRIYGFLSPFIHWRILKTADVFYSGQMQGAWSALIAKIAFQKKFVLNCGYQWSLFAREGGAGYAKRLCIVCIEWIVYRAADHIVVSSASAKEYVMGRYGIPAHRIDTIPNYIDTDIFRPFAIPKKPRSLIFVGRLERQKNINVLFEALTGLEDVQLTVVGSGALRGNLDEYARMHGLNVKFLGVIPNDDLPHELNKHALFVLPSLYEGSPKALFEAMACGMTVVAADSLGIRETVHDGVTGFLCPPTADGLRKIILNALDRADIALAMGKCARQYIIDTCNLDKKIAREAEIFHAVCAPS